MGFGRNEKVQEFMREMFSTSKTFPVDIFFEQVDALITEFFEFVYGNIATVVAFFSFFDKKFRLCKKNRALQQKSFHK